MQSIHLLPLLLFSLSHPLLAQGPKLGAQGEVAVLHAPLGCATSVEQLTGGHLLAAFPSGLVAILDADTGATLVRYREPDDSIVRCWLAPDQRHVAIGPRGGQLEIRTFDEASLGEAEPPTDASPKTPVTIEMEPMDEEEEWTHAAWAPGGQHFVTWRQDGFHGAPDRPVKLWGLDGLLRWEGPLAADAAVHPTVDQLAIVEADRVTIGWPDSDFRTIELPGAYSTIDYSPDGTRLAVGGTSTTIAIEGEERWFHRHTDRRATLSILDAKSGVVIAQTQPDAGIFPKEWLQRVIWSPSGDHLGFSAGKGYIGGILRVQDMKTLRSEFSGGQMWAILEGFWVSDQLYRPCFVMDYQPGHRSLLFNVEDPSARTMTPQPDWRGVTELKGTEDVIVRHMEGLARVTPSTMTVVWSR